MIAYKGFDEKFSCRGQLYNVGKTYNIDSIEICNKGFHSCPRPIDVLNYYNDRFAIVEIPENAKIQIKEDKQCSSIIKIVKEITLQELYYEQFKLDPIGSKVYYDLKILNPEYGIYIGNIIRKSAEEIIILTNIENNNISWNDSVEFIKNLSEKFDIKFELPSKDDLIFCEDVLPQYLDLNKYYWTSTEYNSNYSWRWCWDSGYSHPYFTYDNKSDANQHYCARPIIRIKL